jgi:hypothetical protein
MATFDDVRRIALKLPETSERLAWGTPAWQVNKKSFVWERPLRRADLETLGERAPKGPVLGVHVDHLGIKEAMLADDPNVFFTIPHFNGYPAVLAYLDRISLPALEEVIAEAWLTRAPKRVASAYLKAAGKE